MKFALTFRSVVIGGVVAAVAGAFAPPTVEVEAATPPTIPISQVPLSISIPVHPQVFIALSNSESMDGNLNGAILTGSGGGASGGGYLSPFAGGTYSGTGAPPVSPDTYAIPGGFTPACSAFTGACTGATSGAVVSAPGTAAYTLTDPNGVEYDNSPSRLNVAKESIQSILQSYMADTDFALADYSTSGSSVYPTWVYYMSPLGTSDQPGVFTFTSTAGAGAYANPCYLKVSDLNCLAIQGYYGTGYGAISMPYVVAQISSDDPSVNDVLYAYSGLADAFVTYNGPNPPNPYTTYSISAYNNGGITTTYGNLTAGGGGFTTTPTNAGFIPFSPQVMYAQRGFAYGGSQSATTGNVVVPMTSAGKQPTTSSVQTAISKFTSFLFPETSDASTSEIKAIAGQAPSAGLLSKALAYLPTVAGSGSCVPSQYVVMITDGLPTEDLDGKLWPPLGSAAAIGYGVSATFNADGSLNSTNDQALTDTIAQITLLKSKGIKTYVVGMGAGVNPQVNPQAAATLKAMAVAGGTGAYFPASSPAALVNDLTVILNQVQAGNLSTSAAAVNSTGLNTNSVVYEASYNTNWTGDLRAFPVLANGSVNTSPSQAIWSAQTQIDQQASGTGWSTNRVIATWNPSLNGGAGAGAPFRWGTTGTLASTSISPSQQTILNSTDSLGQSRLHYLRGDQSNEQSNGGPFRNRPHLLGDIVDSNPIYVGAPNGPYANDNGSNPSFNTSYATFETTYANRSPVIYVGANDGMLHAFDPKTGKELFAFVPNGVFANLPNLSNPLYSHNFYVDGSPQAGDVQFADGSWHTLLVGGENAGGQTIYALDVTNPVNLTTEAALAGAVKWEFSDPDMGYSFSTPTIARISQQNSSSPAFATFFGNGYDSVSGHAILYAVNAQTGALLRKIDLCAAITNACNSSLADGLSSVVAASSDGVLGDPVDHVFAGDLQGNLWSINVSNTLPSKWTVRLLFRAADSSGNPQPITTTPSVSLNPNYPGQLGLMVFFGTGQLLATSDLSTTRTQSFYGVWDQPVTSTSSVANAYTRSNLQAQTLTTVTAATSGLPQDVRTVTNNCVYYSPPGASMPTGCTAQSNPTAQEGWYMDLPAAGERVVTDPRLENGAVVFTTNAPTSASSTQCSVGFNSFLMDVNYVNGGSFSQPELDVNGDYTINSGDQVTVGGTPYNPVGMAMGQVYSAAPTIISANLGTAHAVKLVTRSDQTIKSVQERGGGLTRVGWWQLIQ